MARLDLVVLGNLLVDDVVFADGRTRMGAPGGATLYATLGAALWGLRIGIASWRGDDYPAWALEALAARGVDLSGVRNLGKPGLRTWLLYEGRRRQLVHQLDRPSHVEVSPAPEHVPDAWWSARAFHLAPMPFAVQRALVEVLAFRRDALVSLDPFLPLRAETFGAWRALAAHVDVFGLSEDEMEIAGGAAEPRAVLRDLAGGRLRYVVFKRGARGGIVYDVRQDRFLDWPARAERVADPTGAGDAFLAGFLSGCLAGDAVEAALERALVSASFAIEGWGPSALLEAASEQASRRRAEWFGR